MSKIKVKTNQGVVELDSNTHYHCIVRNGKEIIFGKFNSSFLMLHPPENILDIALNPFENMLQLWDFVSHATLRNA